MTINDERLPCGVSLQALLIQVGDGEPAQDQVHQSNCPYCQAALRRLQQDWGEVQALTRQPVAVPPGLTATIMARVRTLAGYVADSILLGHPNGETRISHTVVAKVIQRLAAAVPGVAFASVKLTPRQPPHPRKIDVTLRLIITFGPAIERTTSAVRAIVNRRTTTLTGAQLQRIDITISDITPPPE